MKHNSLKVIPFALAALMLVGCSSDPFGPKDGDKNIVDVENGTTYQEFYDNLYSAHGTEFAAKELILRVAKDVVKNSESFKAYNTAINGDIVEERRDEVLDSFYTSSYKKDGLFDEKLLVKDLQNKGYNIITKDDEGHEIELYVETSDNLAGYKGLGSDDLLKADYSDYFAKKADYDIYTQLLKEEHILTAKKDYFKQKKIRRVQYFTFTPDSSSKGYEIKETIEKALNGKDLISFDHFEAFAQDDFQKAVTDAAMDKIAKDYAVINDEPKTPAEVEYAKTEFIDIYNTKGENKEYTDEEISKAQTAYETYTNNGAYTKEHGYELKKLEVKNTLNYHTKTVSNDDTSSAAIENSIDTKLFKANSEDVAKSNFLDYTDQGAKVFKNGTAYYVVRYEIINQDTEDIILKVQGANALTKNSTNVKNAISDALKSHNVNIYEESLYNYLKDTYGFNK